MIINSGTIREAFQSFNTVFNKAFHEMEAQYPRVAMEVPSETRDENYAWLGAVPSMREWIGDREIKNLAAYGYTIRNKDFEATVTVPRNDLEDDCIGVYKPVFQDLAYSARKHPDKLVFGLFPRSFTEKCFDGKPFISDDHTPAFAGHKAKAQSNKGTYKLVPESYGAARTQMMCLVNDQGEVMNIVPDLLVVAPQKEANTLAVRRVSNCLVRDGLVSDPDIWEHLKYLYDMGFIEFTNRKITPDTAYEQDGVARLTTKGVRFIENGGDPESGIDL